jgi:hypothetical protein
MVTGGPNAPMARAGAAVLPFKDPDGMALELTAPL